MEVTKEQESVRKKSGHYRLEYKEKADDLMDTPGIDEDDVDRALLEGRVTKKKRDEKGVSDWKYTIKGPAVSGRLLYTAGKIEDAEDGKSYVLMTVHWDKKR